MSGASCRGVTAWVFAVLAVLSGCGGDDATPAVPVGYSHTITIDGVNDFSASDEQLTTTSGGSGYLAYVTWDSTYLYIGMDGADIGVTDGSRFVLVYLDGGASTTYSTGRAYGTQQPDLPFGASYHIVVDTSGSATAAHSTDGASWTDESWSFAGDVASIGTFMEMRIPLADTGIFDVFALHVSMVNTTGGSEWTYAGTPSDSFTDGDDPDYTKYYSFDLLSSGAPNSYSSSP